MEVNVDFTKLVESLLIEKISRANDGLAEIKFEEVLNLLPSEDYELFTDVNDGFHYTNPELVGLLTHALESCQLDSVPRLKRGIIPRPVESKFFVYSSVGSFDASSKAYKKALMLVRVASFITRADLKIDDHEVWTFTESIKRNDALSTREKSSLIAKFNYLCELNVVFDEREEGYFKASLNRDKLFEVISAYSSSEQKEIIGFLIDLIISDGNVDKREMYHLKSLYRACEISVRSAKFDVERRAKELNINLTSASEAPSQNELELEDLDNPEDILQGLLLDYEDLS